MRPHFKASYLSLCSLYNGERDNAGTDGIRLDAYEKPVEKPDLELSVTVLNINSGYKGTSKGNLFPNERIYAVCR